MKMIQLPPPSINGQQDPILNGAQVQSLVNVAQSVGMGKISKESGMSILKTAFNMPENEAESIVKEAETPENKDLLVSQDEWITVHPNGKENKGRPLYVEEGETKEQAIKRKYPKKENENKTSNNHLESENKITNEIFNDYGDETIERAVQEIEKPEDIYIVNPNIKEANKNYNKTNGQVIYEMIHKYEYDNDKDYLITDFKNFNDKLFDFLNKNIDKFESEKEFSKSSPNFNPTAEFIERRKRENPGKF